MISDPEFIEKYPEIVDGLLNTGRSNKKSNFNTIGSNTSTIQYDSQIKFGSLTSRTHKQKRNNQTQENNDKLTSKTRDLSFAKLIKKI